VEDEFANCVFYCEAIARNLNQLGIEVDLEAIIQLKQKLFQAFQQKTNAAIQLLDTFIVK